MALKIYSSNHTETLQKSLSSIMLAKPLDNPLMPETVVTPTYAMARWLNLQLATDLGVAANINYLRPAQWFWQLARQYLPELADKDAYGRQVMSWELFDCLQSIPEQSSFAAVRQFCESDETGIKRWQLAERLAACFERYQWYRPEMIGEWSSEKQHHWQAQLWQQLTERLGPHHRVYQVNSLIRVLSDRESLASADNRYSLFALSELPPLYLLVIQALARHCQLQLYIHSPTDQYWADLQSQKRLGQQRLQNPEHAELFETGNELLSAWGRQGQIFQDLLLQADMVESLDIALYQPPKSDTVLEKLQASIYSIEQSTQPVTVDDSITIHSCHSAMRECQVLKDYLLDFLNHDPQLQPEDILVMVPDISTYAASIESVFRYQNTSGLTCNLSDLSLSHEHPSVVSFLQLVSLTESRFTRSDILGLLDNPTLRYQFGIDSQGHHDIVDFINQALVKWGIDGLHKTSFGLPATEENTWQQARNRFFAGYAFGKAGLWNDIALLPCDDGSQSQQIARFWYLFDALCDWKNKLSVERSTNAWRLLLNELLTQFFGNSDSTSPGVQQIREGITACLPEGDISLTPQLVQQLLEKQLYQVEQPGQLYSGGITFCGLRPMRNIPFKVICLLGMNHDKFPRNERAAEFDLMSLYPMGGDPGFRMQDRYLMLETLLCCRQKLYISYTGRSLKDNSELPPSPLVSELIDYIDGNFVIQSADGPGLASAISRQHPMQVYSARQFSGAHFSYQDDWLSIAKSLHTPSKQPLQQWPIDYRLETDRETAVNTDELRRFLQHPLRYFFSQILGIHLFTEHQESDEETFDLDGLQRWQLRQQLANNHLRQVDDSLMMMRAEGQLPHGAAATSSFHKISAEAGDWLSQLDDYQGLPIQSRLIDLPLDADLYLKGRVGSFYAGRGLLSVCAGKLKGRHLLGIWLDHLLLSATSQFDGNEISQLIATDQALCFKPLAVDTARQQLRTYCDLFNEGRRRPLPVFPEASFVWAQQVDEDKARSKVWSTWLNRFNQYSSADVSDPYIDLILRDTGTPPFDQTEFGVLATQLFETALRHGEVNERTI